MNLLLAVGINRWKAISPVVCVRVCVCSSVWKNQFSPSFLLSLSQPLVANIWLSNWHWISHLILILQLWDSGKPVNNQSYITANSFQPLDGIDSDKESLTVLLCLLSHQFGGWLLWSCGMYWCDTLPQVRTDCVHKPRNSRVMSIKMEGRAGRDRGDRERCLPDWTSGGEESNHKLVGL